MNQIRKEGLAYFWRNSDVIQEDSQLLIKLFVVFVEVLNGKHHSLKQTIVLVRSLLFEFACGEKQI